MRYNNISKHNFYWKQYNTSCYIKTNTKNSLPAEKEWNNSVYNYKYNNMLNSPVKDKFAINYIKSFINFIITPEFVRQSERMRTMIRRKSTKMKVFVSKPEIKQNNDRAIINLYIYNREHQLNNIKLLFMKKWLLKNLNLDKDVIFHLLESKYSNVRYFKSNWNTLKNMFHKQLQSLDKYIGQTDIQHGSEDYKKTKRFFLRKEILSDLNRKNFFSSILSLSIIKKRFLLKSLFLFSFFKWVLRAFRIRVIFFAFIKRSERNEKEIQKRLQKKGISIKQKYLAIKKFKLFIVQDSTSRLILDNDIINIKDINTINIIMLKYLKSILEEILSLPFKQERNIDVLFESFKQNYYNNFIKRYLRKELKGIRLLNRCHVTLYKMNNYMPLLKMFMIKIYGKKINFNLVNQKYLSMNSDIFSEAVSVKLRNKTSKTLKVIRKSIRLVKLAKINTESYEVPIIPEYEYSSVALENIYRNVSKERNRNISWLSDINSMLNLIKYKWITGVRLETKGRLTRRYTASRAIYKFKYKGNLKNLHELMNRANLSRSYIFRKSSHYSLFRKEVKPNLQHSFVYSNKKIGSFGVKGWISSN